MMKGNAIRLMYVLSCKGSSLSYIPGTEQTPWNKYMP